MSSVMDFIREGSLSPAIPYTTHLSETVVGLKDGSIMTVFKIDGKSHETATDDELMGWHESLSATLNKLNEAGVALWRTTHHREVREFAAGVFEPGTYAYEFNERYKQRCAQESLYVNDLYLVLILKGSSKALRLGSSRSAKDEARREQLSRLEMLATKAEESLGRYRPMRLGIYKENGIHYSAVYEYLSMVLNGRNTRVPYTAHQACDVLNRCRVTFGSDTFCRDFADSREYGAILAIKSYPSGYLGPGALNRTLTLRFEYVLTHSFTYLGRNEAKESVAAQERKMRATDDDAIEEIEALQGLKALIQSNEISLGQHDMFFTVTAPSAKELNARIAQADDNCNQNGFTMMREDTALKASYAAQLPGNFAFRARRAPITSRNFAALCAFHNYPTGRSVGNQWGPATTMLLTDAGSPFYASLHDMRKSRTRGGAESDDDKAPGNTLILGPIGAGKTTVQTTFVAQCDKFKPTVFTFDRSRGQEIFVRAMGGVYTQLKRGKPTGFNFLRLEPTASNIAFARRQMRALAADGNPLDADYENALSERTLYVMTQEPEEFRNIEHLISSMDIRHEATKRLQQWTEHGDNGWAFTSGDDSLKFEGTRHFGFDATDFLADAATRIPIMSYLFHRVDSYLGTRPCIINVDEMRTFLKDPFFEAFIEEQLLLMRKRDALAILGTQQVSHVIESKIKDALIEQTTSKIMLPNPGATRKHYIDEMGFSEEEFHLIQEYLPENNPRGFLFKQPGVSAVCNLNLAGMKKDLSVLSGTDRLISIMNSARQAAANSADDPQVWLPIYYQMIAGMSS